ncbi:MAG: dienelactone hydrolase family protein [Alphaproteobacteria bacterium]|nr:dienelactone hydrolase family protein [Alphaproteobacteria bacterium]
MSPDDAPLSDLTLPPHDTPAVVATPTGDGPWPGVVVLHDILGMTTDLRQQALWLASEGFLAIAPDFFAHERQPWCVLRAVRQILRRRGRAFEEVEAARAWLAARSDCTGRIGVIGFCLGGGFAVALAVDRGFDAASVNYGMVPKDAETFLAAACPIVGSFGGLDRSLLSSAERLEEVLTTHGIPHDVKIYPEATHAFMNDHVPEEVPRWMLKADRLFGPTGHHAASAQDARARILRFFRAHLEG